MSTSRYNFRSRSGSGDSNENSQPPSNDDLDQGIISIPGHGYLISNSLPNSVDFLEASLTESVDSSSGTSPLAVSDLPEIELLETEDDIIPTDINSQDETQHVGTPPSGLRIQG